MIPESVASGQQLAFNKLRWSEGIQSLRSHHLNGRPPAVVSPPPPERCGRSPSLFLCDASVFDDGAWLYGHRCVV